MHRFDSEKNMEPYVNYKGWDWSELCMAFNLPSEHEDFELYKKSDQDPYAEHNWLRFYLYNVRSNAHWKHYSKSYVLKRAAFEIRSFLAAIAEYDTYEQPIYKGLSQVESDETLISWFSDVCGWCWT